MGKFKGEAGRTLIKKRVKATGWGRGGGGGCLMWANLKWRRGGVERGGGWGLERGGGGGELERGGGGLERGGGGGTGER